MNLYREKISNKKLKEVVAPINQSLAKRQKRLMPLDNNILL